MIECIQTVKKGCCWFMNFRLSYFGCKQNTQKINALKTPRTLPGTSRVEAVAVAVKVVVEITSEERVPIIVMKAALV